MHFNSAAGRNALAEHHVAAAEELRVVGIERGGHEAGRADLPRRADDDAVLVDEIDAPVGCQRSVDLRHVAAGDAVEDRGVVGKLVDPRRFARPDGELFPVHDRAHGAVVDHDLACAEAGNRDIAHDNDRICRIGQRLDTNRHRGQGNGREQAPTVTAFEKHSGPRSLSKLFQRNTPAPGNITSRIMPVY